MNFELRNFVDPVEFRSAVTGTHIVATGVAMRYEARSKPLTFHGRGVAREKFRPGAFAKTIQESDVRSHNEHFGPYLGRTGAGTLRLHDSRSELSYELDLPDTTAGRDTAVLLERGDIKGSSIGFRALPKGGELWSTDDDGLLLRSVVEARLGFVDLTTAPAYDDSTAEMALRSLASSHSITFDDVCAAIDVGDLRSLIFPPKRDENPDESDNDGRGSSTISRRRIAWLHA